ncbi:unnamed protein product, partial [Owenia fusiformis]
KMAAVQSKSDNKLSLEIRTKSVEQTLVPLVTQITTLVNHREHAKLTERTLKALHRVGQAVQLAVERFVTVGESIGEDNEEIRSDMCVACKDARTAGTAICQLTDLLKQEDPSKSLSDKTGMVRAARQLLSAITKVLILADRVVVKDLLKAKDKVLVSLNKVEHVDSFSGFVKAFSTFGTDMVDLAHLTGDRQNDLKSDKHRAQMGAARAVLEKSTMMLLTTSKCCLRHPDCEAAGRNRQSVFQQMHRALDLVQQIVQDKAVANGDMSPTPTVNSDSGIGLAQHLPLASRALKEFDDVVQTTRVTMVTNSTHDRLQSALDIVIETTQDFTDSAYTPHQARERILQLCEKLRVELTILIRIGLSLNNKASTSPTQELETAILRTLDISKLLKKQLQQLAMEQASDIFKQNEDHELLTSLRLAGMNGQETHVNEISVRFEEHAEQLQEACKLLRHVATSDPLIVTTDHIEGSLKALTHQVIWSCQALSSNPASKIAKENFEVYAEAWATQINDLSVLVKDVNDVCAGKMDKQVYMSLPRPGKHGAMAKTMRPIRLDSEEQAKIAKLGLEMKLITSEMDAETEKWEEPNNDIVKRAKNMSSMAFSMYLFTRGEGPLKTTQDLFMQAEYFADEGNKLYKTVREFSSRVPVGSARSELLNYLERIPQLGQQLLFTIKSPTFGKQATFNKVDNAIQETKNLMNAVAKVVTTCFICATKYNIDYQSSSSHSQYNRWRSPPQMDVRSNGSYGSDTESVRSAGVLSDGILRSSSLQKNMTTIHAFEHM